MRDPEKLKEEMDERNRKILDVAFELFVDRKIEALARKGGAVSEGQSTAVGAEKKKSAQADWKQNRPQKLKFTYKEQREFETIDDDIAALEELLEKLDKDMEANATNSVKLREIMEQKEKAQADLDEKMDRWVYLNDLAERIEAQKSEK